MSVVLEGPDNSGKTSLARALCSAVQDCEYFHAGGPPADLEAEIRCLAHQDHLVARRVLVVDRCTSISQSVYNPNEYLDPWRKEFRSRMITAGAVVVYCRPGTDWLLRTQDLSWRENEPDELKQKIVRNQHTYVERYDQLMSQVQHLSYDFQDSTHTLLAEKLSLYLKGDSAAEQWLHRCMQYSRQTVRGEPT